MLTCIILGFECSLCLINSGRMNMVSYFKFRRYATNPNIFHASRMSYRAYENHGGSKTAEAAEDSLRVAS